MDSGIGAHETPTNPYDKSYPVALPRLDNESEADT
jgi:hypothetical protein